MGEGYTKEQKKARSNLGQMITNLFLLRRAPRRRLDLKRYIRYPGFELTSMNTKRLIDKNTGWQGGCGRSKTPHSRALGGSADSLLICTTMQVRDQLTPTHTRE